MNRKESKSSKKILTKKEPEKRLILRLKKRAGRARFGRITVRHRGKGAKRLYRIVDFGQEKLNTPAKVIALEYDPYRTGFLVLLEYKDGDKRYRIASQGLKIGSDVICAEKTEIRLGNRMKIQNVPVGTTVYNIEIKPGQGGKIVRGAGTGAKILAHEQNFTHLEMPSGEIRKVSQESFATVGMVSRPEWRYITLKKAGRARWLGRRPAVRGKAMVPAAHPHGGGEGRAPIGLKYPKTPWGKPARGVKTRKRKWTDKYIIKRRGKRKK